MKFLVVIMLVLGFSAGGFAGETFILAHSYLNPGAKLALWSIDQARAIPKLVIAAEVRDSFALESFEIFPADGSHPAVVLGISSDTPGRVWRFDQNGLTFPSEFKAAGIVRRLEPRTAILSDRNSDELVAFEIDSSQKKIFRPAGWMGQSPVIDVNISGEQALSALNRDGKFVQEAVSSGIKISRDFQFTSRLNFSGSSSPFRPTRFSVGTRGVWFEGFSGDPHSSPQFRNPPDQRAILYLEHATSILIPRTFKPSKVGVLPFPRGEGNLTGMAVDLLTDDLLTTVGFKPILIGQSSKVGFIGSDDFDFRHLHSRNQDFPQGRGEIWTQFSSDYRVNLRAEGLLSLDRGSVSGILAKPQLKLSALEWSKLINFWWTRWYSWRGYRGRDCPIEIEGVLFFKFLQSHPALFDELMARPSGLASLNLKRVDANTLEWTAAVPVYRMFEVLAGPRENCLGQLIDTRNALLFPHR